MINRVGLHPGAIWRKIDLQCHSPRDPGWNDPHGLPGDTQEHLVARKQWADSFVNEVCKKALSVFSITDHHDATMVTYVVEAAKENENLIFFPGMEITCDDAVQCLAIFEPSSSQDDWDKLVQKLPSVQPTPRQQGRFCRPIPFS